MVTAFDISAFALVVALSLDSFGAGLAYGLRSVRLNPAGYLVIAMCTAALMGASMAAGSGLAALISPVLARRLGALLLIIVGIWQLGQGWNSYRASLDASSPTGLVRIGIRPLGLIVHILVEPTQADRDRSGAIDTSEALALGLALGLDALGGGLGAAMAGFSWLAVPLVAAACPLFVGLGQRVVRLPAHRWLAGKAFALPGLLLMTLGLIRL